MTVRITILAMTMMICATVVQAQSFSASAIQIDITSSETGTEPLLIAAYQPQPDVAARLNAFGAGTTLAAFSAKAGLPTPSIVLGRIEAGQEAAFGIESLLPATVEQVGFDYTDLEARAALRASDPILFQKLIEQGHVDPPEGQLNRVLQTELKRMNCYRSGIDGAWGPGSRRSVGAYFDEVDGVEQTDQQPSMDLFRTIIMRADVACPTPVAAVRRVTPNTSAKRSSTTKTTRRAAKKPAAAKPRAASKPKINTGAVIGAFR